AMLDAFDELKGDPLLGPTVIGEFEWFGVEQMGPSEVVVRGRIRTRPGQQWAVRRAYNTILKRILGERGIEIPYPHQKVYFGDAPETVPSAVPGPRRGKRTRGTEAADDASARTRDLPGEDDSDDEP